MTIKTFNHTYTFLEGKCYRDGHYFGDIIKECSRFFIVQRNKETKTFPKHG
jgi:hypothetical protein